MPPNFARSSLTLVTGGARSGKSSFAEKTALESGLEVVFLATAHAGDPEMETRIEKHRRDRPVQFTTRETPLDPVSVLKAESSKDTMMLLDCFTVLLSNHLLQEAGVTGENPGEEELLNDVSHLEEAAGRVEEFVEKLAEACLESPSPLLVVTNEVGMGLVPENLLGRVFRDLAGRSNQLMASRAEQVWFVISGIPRRFK